MFTYLLAQSPIGTSDHRTMPQQQHPAGVGGGHAHTIHPRTCLLACRKAVQQVKGDHITHLSDAVVDKYCPIGLLSSNISAIDQLIETSFLRDK